MFNMHQGSSTYFNYVSQLTVINYVASLKDLFERNNTKKIENEEMVLQLKSSSMLLGEGTTRMNKNSVPGCWEGPAPHDVLRFHPVQE
jgi:hypothetical protein